jgi:hypothetical protein
MVAAAIGRAVLEHQRRLRASAGPEAPLLASLSLHALEAKLASVKQQASLVHGGCSTALAPARPLPGLAGLLLG